MPTPNDAYLEGKFKTLDEIKQILGIDDPQLKLDRDYEGDLNKIAEQEILLINFNPIEKTFFPAFKRPHPSNPNSYVTVTPTAREMRSMKYLNTELLETVACNNCDDYIYCTGCGSTFLKDYRYPIEPHFSYGQLYDGECTIETTDQNNISGTTIVIKACGDQPHEIFCSTCREYHIFKTLDEALQ